MRELGAFARGHQRARAFARADALWSAWHVAAFTRAKKIPELAPLVRRVSGVAHRASPDEMLAKARMINQALGGRVRPRGERIG